MNILPCPVINVAELIWSNPDDKAILIMEPFGSDGTIPYDCEIESIKLCCCCEFRSGITAKRMKIDAINDDCKAMNGELGAGVKTVVMAAAEVVVSDVLRWLQQARLVRLSSVNETYLRVANPCWWKGIAWLMNSWKSRHTLLVVIGEHIPK